MNILQSIKQYNTYNFNITYFKQILCLFAFTYFDKYCDPQIAYNTRGSTEENDK